MDLQEDVLLKINKKIHHHNGDEFYYNKNILYYYIQICHIILKN